MQLFVLDYDPQRAAQMLCDVHLRKMCLETAQILSAAAVNLHLALPEILPKPYNRHHPAVKMLALPSMLQWTLQYNRFLHGEYFFRFGKSHVYSYLINIYAELLSPYAAADNTALKTLCGVFKDFTPQSSDIVEAYREYYLFKKTQMRSWHYSRRQEPVWLERI